MPTSGKTKLQIINEVLPRLREATVATSSSTTYAVLVSAVLNLVKTQIEQAWQWLSLRDTFTITATSGVTTYALTSSGQYAQIKDIYNTTTQRQLVRGTYKGFNDKFFGVSTVQTGNITEYQPVGLDANLDLTIDVWPSPTATNTLKANLYLPAPDPATDATAILTPNQVLIEGMVAYLMAERGDDGGIAAQTQMTLYQDLLAGAIAAESGHDPSQIDFEAV